MCILDAKSAFVGGEADVVGVDGPGKVGDALRMASEVVEESQGLGRLNGEGFV